MSYIWNKKLSDKYVIDEWPIAGIEAYKDRNNGEIKVNPNIRFEKIFAPALKSDTVLDDNYINIMFHILAEIDRKSYINRFTIKKNLLLNDIENGILGKNIKDNISVFSKTELADTLTCLLETLDGVDMYHLFEKICKKIFPNASKLYFFESSKSFYIYLGIKEDSINTKKIGILKELFWDITADIKIYFDKHFGIIGIVPTMKIDNITID